MKKRLTAVAIAFGAAAMLGGVVPATAQAQAPTTVSESGQSSQMGWHYHGAYSSFWKCAQVGMDYEYLYGYPWTCEEGNNDGRRVHNLYLFY